MMNWTFMPHCEALNFEKRISQNTRVLVVNPQNTYWSFHITSEAALRAKELSNEVCWYNVGVQQDKEFEINRNDYISPLKWKKPEYKLENVLKFSGVKVLKPVKDFSNFQPKLDFRNLSELRDYRIGNFNIGAMVYSAITSAKGHTFFTVEDVNLHIRYFINQATLIQNQIAHAIDLISPDIILTTNDRLIGSSISMYLAKVNNIESHVIYFGSSKNSIQDYNSSLYDSKIWQSEITKKWTINPPSKNELKILERDLQIFSNTPNENSQQFLHRQKQGKGIDLAKKSCIFYAGSEHEHSPNFVSNPNEGFTNQYVAFTALQKVCLELDYQLILKFHPFSKKVEVTGYDRWMVDWANIEIDPRVIQILPDSDLDTYTLVGQSSFNIVWGSIVGLESIARGKQTIVLGSPHWLRKNWKIHAWQEEQIKEILQNNIAPPLLKPSALLPWFWYLREYGSPCRHSELNHSVLVVNGIEIFVPRVLGRVLNVKNTILGKLKALGLKIISS